MKMDNSDINIREMVLNDANQVFKLDVICFSEAWSLESFQYELTENIFARYYVAEDINGTIIGYSGLWHILDEGHITNVAVHPSFRQRGIGKDLVSKLIEESIKDGIKTFTLEVRKSNEPAIHLYKNFGFVEAGIRKGYYQDKNEDAIIMWRHND